MVGYMQCVLPFLCSVYHQGGGTQDIDTIHVQRKSKIIRNLTANWDHSTITNLQNTRKELKESKFKSCLKFKGDTISWQFSLHFSVKGFTTLPPPLLTVHHRLRLQPETNFPALLPPVRTGYAFFARFSRVPCFLALVTELFPRFSSLICFPRLESRLVYNVKCLRSEWLCELHIQWKTRCNDSKLEIFVVPDTLPLVGRCPRLVQGKVPQSKDDRTHHNQY